MYYKCMKDRVYCYCVLQVIFLFSSCWCVHGLLLLLEREKKGKFYFIFNQIVWDSGLSALFRILSIFLVNIY